MNRRLLTDNRLSVVDASQMVLKTLTGGASPYSLFTKLNNAYRSIQLTKLYINWTGVLISHMRRMKESDYVLSDKQSLVLRTRLMRLPVAKALEVIKNHKYKMKRSAYFDNLKKIKAMRHNRLIHIAKSGMEDRHLLTLDTLEMCEAEYWINYNNEDSPLKKSIILDKIVQLQPWISSYVDESQDIIEKQMKSLKLAESTPPDSLAKTDKQT